MDAVLALELQLEEELRTYQLQLDTVCERLEDGTSIEKESLQELKKTLKELLTITEERLLDAKKQKLLLVFSEQGSQEVRDCLLREELSETGKSEPDVQQDEQIGQDHLEWDIGDKCRAPLQHSWGAEDVHDAMVYSLPEDAMVCVLFLRPLYTKMKPCSFFLEGKCRFDEKQCRHSHGHTLASSLLTHYREPEGAGLGVGSHCLARSADGLWERGAVCDITENSVTVRLEGKSEETVFEHDAIHSLGGDVEGEESSETSSDDDQEAAVVVLASHHVSKPRGFGEWEEHTRGIGSKLMAKMGYTPGQGLGKDGKGRMDPVDIVILPERMSLDACIELRENGKLKKIDDQKKTRRKKGGEGGGRGGAGKDDQAQAHEDVFSYMNSALSTPLRKSSTGTEEGTSRSTNTAPKSQREINIQMLKVQEDMKSLQKRIFHFKQSLERNKHNSQLKGQIQEKLDQSSLEMQGLVRRERSLKTKMEAHKNRQRIF